MDVNSGDRTRLERSEREAQRAGTLKAEQSQATRAALIAAARELFARDGYAAVATEEIVRAAGVTRGALYHHFAGKAELFSAVYEDVERRLVEQIAQSAMASATDPLQALLVGRAGVPRRVRGPRGAAHRARRRAVGARLGAMARDRHALRAWADRGGRARRRWTPG